MWIKNLKLKPLNFWHTRWTWEVPIWIIVLLWPHTVSRRDIGQQTDIRSPYNQNMQCMERIDYKVAILTRNTLTHHIPTGPTCPTTCLESHKDNRGLLEEWMIFVKQWLAIIAVELNCGNNEVTVPIMRVEIRLRNVLILQLSDMKVWYLVDFADMFGMH